MVAQGFSFFWGKNPQEESVMSGGSIEASMVPVPSIVLGPS
jgi:hypothetical protein